MEKSTKEQEEIWHKDPNNWHFGIYYNKEDNRVLVPKRIKWMGFTLNFAKPKSYIALIVMILFFGFVITMITSNKN